MKECKHEWIPLGNDRWSCKNCAMVKVGYVEELREENRVLKRALELACKELEARDENKTHAKLVIQQIKNKWLGENVGYKDWFIKQAKESKRNE